MVVGKCALAAKTWEDNGILGSTADLQLLRHTEQAILIFVLVFSLLHSYDQALRSEAKSNIKNWGSVSGIAFYCFFSSEKKKKNLSIEHNLLMYLTLRLPIIIKKKPNSSVGYLCLIIRGIYLFEIYLFGIDLFKSSLSHLAFLLLLSTA